MLQATQASLLGLALLFAFWRLYIALLSSLAKLPNAHPLAPWTKLWLLWLRRTGQEHRTRYQLHQKLGPVIRLGPSEVSVNCIEDGVQIIYGNDFDKSSWFANFDFYGQPFMFQMLPASVHIQRKRMMSQVYSKTYVQHSQELTDILRVILGDRLVPRLRAVCLEPIAIHRENQALALDVTSAYTFGLGVGSNFVQDPETRDYFIESFTQSLNGIFWLNEFPSFTRWVRRLGIRLVPSSVYESQKIIESFCWEMCQKAKDEMDRSTDEKPSTWGNGVLYRHLRPKIEQLYAGSKNIDKLMAAEMLDHLIAGNDGAGNTLTFLTYELSRNPGVQQRVREELKSISDDTPQALENLPLLDAVLMETMRLHPAGLGPHMRVVPPQGAKLGPYSNIPPGTTVSATAWAMHRKEDIYPSPEEWKPERWLEKSELEKKEMQKWFFAFGAGGRKCIGNFLGIRVIKTFTSVVYSRFETSIVEDSGFTQADAHMGRPSGKPLLIKFRDLEAED